MAKNANGEGTKITRRPDGRYWARYTTTLTDGTKKRVPVYGKTKQEVRQKLTQALADRDRGVTYNPATLTVEQYLNRWLEDAVKLSLAPSTQRHYKYRLQKHVIPRLGHMKLKDLQPSHLQSLYARLLAEGNAANSVRVIHAIISSALTKAVRWKLVPHNPALDADPPKEEETEYETLSPEEAARLLEALKRWRDGEYETLFTVALAGGLRIGELLGLWWPDVDARRNVLSIRRSLHTDSRPIVYGPPKGGRARSVTLPPAVMEMLQAHRGKQKVRSLSEPLIFTRDGKYLIAAGLRRAWYKFLEKEQFPRVRVHDLRHTCATLLMGQDVHPSVVQQMLGHRSITLTLDRYSHVTPNLQRVAAERMENVLFSANGTGLASKVESNEKQ